MMSSFNSPDKQQKKPQSDTQIQTSQQMTSQQASQQQSHASSVTYVRPKALAQTSSKVLTPTTGSIDLEGDMFTSIGEASTEEATRGQKNGTGSSGFYQHAAERTLPQIDQLSPQEGLNITTVAAPSERPDDSERSMLDQENTRQSEFKKNDQAIKHRIRELESQIKTEQVKAKKLKSKQQKMLAQAEQDDQDQDDDTNDWQTNAEQAADEEFSVNDDGPSETPSKSMNKKASHKS